jgi:hypothetical protein
MPERTAEESQHSAHELMYFSEGGGRASSAAIGGLFLLPLCAYATVQVVTDSIALGIFASAASVVVPIVLRRRATSRPRATFRVEDELLLLSGPAFPVPRRVELRYLHEVHLDTKTIQRLRESPSPVPQLRFLNQSVGGEQDVSRIALEFANDTVFLTEERVSHLEANEWFAKIRRFLRRNGWTPIDERRA